MGNSLLLLTTYALILSIIIIMLNHIVSRIYGLLLHTRVMLLNTYIGREGPGGGREGGEGCNLSTGC